MIINDVNIYIYIYIYVNINTNVEIKGEIYFMEKKYIGMLTGLRTPST